MNNIAKTGGDVTRIETVAESLAILSKDWTEAVRATRKANSAQ